MSRSFVIPAASNGSPDSAARKRRMAEIMLAQSAGAEPISSPWQGAAKLAQALMGGLAMKSAERSESKGREGANAALLRALTGGQTVHQGDDPMGALVQGINDPWQSEMGQKMLWDKYQKDTTPYKPDWQTFNQGNDIYRYDQNNPNDKPALFFDGPEPPPDPMKALQAEKLRLDIEQQRNPRPDPGKELDLKIKQLQFEQMQQPDPAKALTIEKMKLELEQMRNPPPKQTDDMLEYEFAVKNGFKGTPQQFWQEMKKAGSSSVTVNNGSEVGTIPPGFELFTDPATNARSMRPIPGGPAAMDVAGAKNKEDLQRQSILESATLVGQDIDRALNVLKGDTFYNPATGLTAGVAGLVPGSNASKLRALTDTIQANIGFDKLAAMRAASPTGGALGAVTERELALLSATLGSIEASQGEEQLAQNLKRLKTVYEGIMHKVKTGKAPEIDAITSPELEPSAGEWVTMPNGVKIRQK